MNKRTESNAGLAERIRELRKQHRWTLDRLSSASGVSRSMLSEIERGRANPTLAVALRIAEAFSLTLDQLVENSGGRRGIECVRKDDENYIFRADPDCRIRTLSPLHMEKDIEFYEVCLQGGANLNSEAHFRGTREVVTVNSGILDIIAGSHREKLATGDSACYPADQPHTLSNANSKDPLILYLIVLYRS